MARESMYDQTEVPADRYDRTVPWMPDEYMRIGTTQLVYTKEGNDYVVHFHGGDKEFLSALRSRGVPITMPRVMRTRDRTAPKP